MADIPAIVWELAENIYDDLFGANSELNDSTGRKWCLREAIDGIRRDAVKPYKEKIAVLEAELTQAHADNAKLETLWENAVAARDKLSEDLTRARADRDAAREALERVDKAIIDGRAELKSAMLSGDIPETQNTAKLVAADMFFYDAWAAIKAEGE